MVWYLYIVHCRDKSFYTGITPDIARRLLLHNSGMGAKSLRGKLPVELIYKEEYQSKVAAMKREREVKGWSRAKKLRLVACGWIGS